MSPNDVNASATTSDQAETAQTTVEPTAAEQPLAEATSQEAPPAVEEEAPRTTVDGAPAVTARDVSMSQSTVDLLKFTRFTDFVPCDYNKDGIVDILALNSRLSTGYGFCGVGNGLFKEGPSFDLPFRPAAAAKLGNSGDAVNGFFLVSSVGTVSLFYPLLDEDPTMTSKAAQFSVFRVDTADGPVFSVHGKGETSVHIYSFVSGGLQDSGERTAVRADDITDWYKYVTTWDPADMQAAFPLTPVGMERTARIADLNGDTIPDLVYYDSGNIVYLLSQDGRALANEQTASCHAKPTSLRVADIDGNGFADVMALIGSSGVLEVYLTEPN